VGLRALSFLLAAMLLAPRVGWTANAGEVEALIHEGIELRRQRQDVRALPLFQRAYALQRTPRTAGQLGLCELAIGYWQDAEEHLQEALASPGYPWVANNIEALTASLELARSNIGAVAVSGSPTGAEVRINGKTVGTLPLPSSVRLAHGPADVEVRAAGYTAAKRSISIGADPVQLRVDLSRESTHVAPALSSIAPATNTAPAPPPHVDVAPTQLTSRSSSQRWAAWALGGTAVAALALGVVETIIWQGGIADFNDHRTNGMLDCQKVVADRGGAWCKSTYDNYTSAEHIAIGGYIAAGALTLGAATLVILSRPTHRDQAVAVRCVPTPSPGLACRLSF
jgi:hypothetical protein